jgi:hypothetical protein
MLLFPRVCAGIESLAKNGLEMYPSLPSCRQAGSAGNQIVPLEHRYDR